MCRGRMGIGRTTLGMRPLRLQRHRLYPRRWLQKLGWLLVLVGDVWENLPRATCSRVAGFFNGNVAPSEAARNC
jgi:hypothetical protein